MSPILRRASSADAAAVADVWAAAMTNEPMVRWPLAERDAAIAPMFASLAADYVDGQVVWVDDDVRSAAAWLPPEMALDTTAFDERIMAAIAAHTDDDGGHYFRFWTWVAEHMPEEPVWFLDVLGVTPSAQGLGLGSALVQHGLALADADGVAALLETGNPDNVDYYRRFGFDVWHQEAAPDGGPVVNFMMRRPS